MELPDIRRRVLPEWIDANGHMNMAYYVVLFDQATDLMYETLGVGQAYREATGNSTFTVETHTLYEREVRVGERVRVTSHCWPRMPSACTISSRCSTPKAATASRRRS